MGKNRGFSIFLFRIIPKGFLSRLTGCFARINLPSFLLNGILNWYIDKYRVKREEILFPDGGFKCLDDFFYQETKGWCP